MHSGKLTADTIDQDYYFNLAKKLTEAVAEGLGGSFFEADDYRNTLKAYLDQNIYAFSGAKSLTVLQQYNKLLTDDEGNVVPFAEFKRRVLAIDKLYNKIYLDAEYDTAISSAQMAEKWQGLKVFKILEYRTTGGENVCPICGGLNKLRAPSNSPIWNTIYAPNHFKCHCNIIPAPDDAEITDPDHANNLVKAAGIQPLFRVNVGKERVIFKNNHPYYKNLDSGKIRELDAVKNYNMPSVEKIYATADLPTYTPMATKTDALAWWAKQLDDKKDSFEVKAKDNLSVIFDGKYKNHVLNENSNDRYRFLHLSGEIVKNPDEIWSNRLKGRLAQVYIKYYKDFPIALAVGADNQVSAITMYEVQKDGKLNYKAITNIRKGVLKYKK